MAPLTPADSAVERDSITGLQSRRAFSRQVTQVSADGDSFAVALISLEEFDATAQVVGFTAADDLLVYVGRALANHMSATTTVARTGDHQFSVLSLGPTDENLTRWVSPIVTSLKLTVDEWAGDQSNFTLQTITPPPVKVGASMGSGEGTWTQARLALSAAINNVDGDDVVYYQKQDSRIQDLEKRTKRDSAVLQALAEENIMVANQRIELAGRSEQNWTWFRLTAAIAARGASFDLLRSFNVAPRIGRQLEQRVFEAVSQLASAEDGPVKVTVPVSRELLSSRSFNEQLFRIMESARIPPSRVVFEIEEEALRQSQKRSSDLINKLDQIGSAVAINNCSGNWHTWQLITELPVSYVTPNLDLYDRFSEANNAAVRVVTSMAATCDELDIEIIAPFSSRLVPASTLVEVGITYIERGATIGTARRTAPPSDIGFGPR